MSRWVVQLQARVAAGDGRDIDGILSSMKPFSPVPVLGAPGALRVSVDAETLVEAEDLVTGALEGAGFAESTEVVSVVRYTPTAELPTAEIPEV